MPDQNTMMPNDAFSRRRRELDDNPGALRASSTVEVRDFYGNLETWVIDTYRVEGQETSFLQRSAVEGGLRLMLPPEVMVAMNRQRDSLDTRSRRRGARQAVETKRAKGIPVGNAAALRKHRSGRRAGSRRRSTE